MTMTETEFAAMIEYEGGIDEALELWITGEDCEPGKLRHAWQTYYDLMHKPQVVIAREELEAELDRAMEVMV